MKVNHLISSPFKLKFVVRHFFPLNVLLSPQPEHYTAEYFMAGDGLPFAFIAKQAGK